MDNFKSLYKVTEDFICDNSTFVIEDTESIIGFYAIVSGEKGASLEYFYIEPKSIGKGYGKLLWNHMINYCKNICAKEIVFVTSPQAKDFYIKMGAVQCDEIASIVIEGRKIPKLVYKLEK